jgi:nucleotide-binding universal stress UspA family protein
MNAAENATIVVGTDGSEHAARALGWAIEEAKLRDAQIHVVTAWHVPTAAYGAPGFVPLTTPSIEETFRKAAEEAAATATEQARSAGVRVDVSVKQGQPADVLLDAAASADLLVVGSRGHGGFVGLLLGSVSAQCAHHAPCPLVIAR